jgi:hypothetical protein
MRKLAGLTTPQPTNSVAIGKAHWRLASYARDGEFSAVNPKRFNQRSRCRALHRERRIRCARAPENELIPHLM